MLTGPTYPTKRRLLDIAAPLGSESWATVPLTRPTKSVPRQATDSDCGVCTIHNVAHLVSGSWTGGLGQMVRTVALSNRYLSRPLYITCAAADIRAARRRRSPKAGVTACPNPCPRPTIAGMVSV